MKLSALAEKADSHTTVWGSSHSNSGSYDKALANKKTNRRNTAGRLVAITATGPIYRSEADLVVLPMSVGLAFIQELAARALNPQAQVVSSLANRVGGDTAMAAWANTCGIASATLMGASPRTRLTFLNQVLSYVRREKNANGIEPIVGAAVNAAWPWIAPATLARVLTLTSKYLGKSEFAAKTAIPIFDPNTRTFTVFAPGALAKIDPDEWLDWRTVDREGFDGRDLPGTGGGGNGTNDVEGLLGPRGPNKSDLPGADGRPGAGRDGDNFGGAIGDLLGPRGPNTSDLPGADGRRQGGDRRDNDLNRAIEDLLGSRRPSLAGLEGADGRRRGDRDQGGLEGLAGGLLGRGPDLSNLGENGGPFGHGAGLGPGGAWTPNDDDKTWGNTVKSVGMAAYFGGVALSGAGLLATGLGNPAGPFVVGGGVGLSLAGQVAFVVGFVAERKADAEKPGPASPAPSGSTPAPSNEPTPIDVHKLPDAKPTDVHKLPDAKPTEPKHTDLYPDPDGGGGGGNPTQLPDFDGAGGGNPTTLWDENGGGGNPTTLWDENGGGGNPTTTGRFVTVTMSTGQGLLAGMTQVGPATFAV